MRERIAIVSYGGTTPFSLRGSVVTVAAGDRASAAALAVAVWWRAEPTTGDHD